MVLLISIYPYNYQTFIYVTDSFPKYQIRIVVFGSQCFDCFISRSAFPKYQIYIAVFRSLCRRVPISDLYAFNCLLHDITVF